MLRRLREPQKCALRMRLQQIRCLLSTVFVPSAVTKYLCVLGGMSGIAQPMCTSSQLRNASRPASDRMLGTRGRKHLNKNIKYLGEIDKSVDFVCDFRWQRTSQRCQIFIESSLWIQARIQILSAFRARDKPT